LAPQPTMVHWIDVSDFFNFFPQPKHISVALTPAMFSFSSQHLCHLSLLLPCLLPQSRSRWMFWYWSLCLTFSMSPFFPSFQAVDTSYISLEHKVGQDCHSLLWKCN
jgi:hypothetical protein